VSADEPRKILPLVWVGADDLPVYFANQFLGQADATEIYLTLGQVVPPALFGPTEDEQREQIDAIDDVTVRPIVRLGFTPARLAEFIDVLTRTMEIHEAARQRDQGDSE
jgi:hypothetical protein